MFSLEIHIQMMHVYCGWLRSHRGQAKTIDFNECLCSLHWSGLEWTGVDWSGLEWTGVDWSGAHW